MSLYDALKDVIGIAQKSDNIELYRQLLDLGAQALEMQAEIAALREENSELKRTRDLENEIQYHLDAYVTKTTDTIPIKYCAACWVDKKKLVPMQDVGMANYKCPLCQSHIVDNEKHLPEINIPEPIII